MLVAIISALGDRRRRIRSSISSSGSVSQPKTYETIFQKGRDGGWRVSSAVKLCKNEDQNSDPITVITAHA